MSSTISLKDRQTDATQKLIISKAVDLLESEGVNATTARAVARRAGISERTIFRYYASRDELLDAIAAEVVNRVRTPPPPGTIAELLEYADPLYRCFEQWSPLLRAALHTDVSNRVRATVGETRWHATHELIDQHAPHRSESDRRIAATNINYYLSASTWAYYRTQFDFSLDDAIAAARWAIRSTIDNISARA